MCGTLKSHFDYFFYCGTLYKKILRKKEKTLSTKKKCKIKEKKEKKTRSSPRKKRKQVLDQEKKFCNLTFFYKFPPQSRMRAGESCYRDAPVFKNSATIRC